MDVRCPKCGKSGRIEALGIGVANDNLIILDSALAVDIPDGFRVVVFGWSSPYEHLCCVKCGVPAKAPAG